MKFSYQHPEALADLILTLDYRNWSEEDHPRHEAGSPEGGRFAPGEGGSGSGWEKTSPEKFINARDTSARGGFLSHVTPDDLKDHLLLTGHGGKVGVAISPDDDIQNVFNNGGPKGAAADAMLAAIDRGGRTLDCYDGFLPEYYAQFGFEETARMKFNREFAPPDWDYAKYGEPDVVFMHWTGFDRDKKAIRERAGNRKDWRTHGKTTRYTTDWDQAKADSRRAGSSGRDGAEPWERLRAAERGAYFRAGPSTGGNLTFELNGQGPEALAAEILSAFHLKGTDNDHDQSDHAPGGSKADSSQPKGRLTTQSEKEFVGEFPINPATGEAYDYDSPEWRGHREREAQWQSNIREDLSLGRITPKEARALGYHYTGFSDSQEQWQPLPQEIWHVTTAADAVMQDGLKSRAELKQESGMGLGGGSSDTISFTADPKVAEGIYRGLLEAREIATGNMSAHDLIKLAETGSGAPRQWASDVMSYWRAENWKVGDPYPYGFDTLLRGVDYEHTVLGTRASKLPPGSVGVFPWKSKASDGETIYGGYEIPMSREKLIDRTFDFFKTWAAFREYAGGPMDPLFFLSDVKGLAATNPAQIKIGKFKPVPGGSGFKQSALGEWRTYTGKAVEPVEMFKPEVKLFHLAGTDQDHDQSTHGREGGDGYKTIDTTKLPDDTMLGHAGRIIDGEIVGFHVTSDPEPLAKALRAGGDLANTRLKGDTGDLGGGLYFSYAPQLWMNRATSKWSFLKELKGNQNMLLAENLLDEVSKQRKEKYISQSEFDYAERIINQFAQTEHKDVIVGLAGQPYNISFWKPDYLNKLGITPGKQPIEIEVRARGKFAEVDTSGLDSDQVKMLRGKGFDGAFVRGGMSNLPQTVIWNKNAITRFGDYRNKKDFHLAYHLEGAHDESDHGNWANGQNSDTGASKTALQKHLVDYKAERDLTGPGTIPIKELLPKSESIGYLDVPGIDKMHRLMQVKPSLQTDPKKYVDARDRLFNGEPLVLVPISSLTFTQPKINTGRAQELTKAPEQLKLPVQVVQSGSKFFLMNGHHRVIASHMAGRGEISANLLDLNRPHEFEWFPYHLPGQHDQQTHNPHIGSDKKVAMETKFLKDRATKAEPVATKLISEVVKRNQGKLEGLDFRVKSEESLARKIAARARANPGLEPGDVAANSISDALRYTAVLKDDNYSTAVKDMLSHLESKGFKIDAVKNYWHPGDDYEGINVALRDPENLKVELQFHTPDSFHVKEKESHPLYEKMRTTKDPSIAKQLRQQMIDAWAKVKVPAGVMTLGTLLATS